MYTRRRAEEKSEDRVGGKTKARELWDVIAGAAAATSYNTRDTIFYIPSSITRGLSRTYAQFSIHKVLLLFVNAIMRL